MLLPHTFVRGCGGHEAYCSYRVTLRGEEPISADGVHDHSALTTCGRKADDPLHMRNCVECGFLTNMKHLHACGDGWICTSCMEELDL